MILFGSYTKVKSLLFLEGEIKCSTCFQTVHLELIKKVTWFTLFFIPIFPLHTSYALRCPLCLSSQKISKKDAKNIMSQHQKEH